MAKQTSPPQISIIIPVLHEADGIQAQIAHLMCFKSDFKPEIIIVDGDSAGSTIRHMSYPHIVTMTAPTGRATQMNAGAAIASGSILLFLHVDTFLPANGLSAIQNVMRDSDVIAGAFDLSFDSPRPGLRLIAGMATRRSRLTRIPYGDQAIFVRADVFRQLGGYAPIGLMEDVELMRRLKKITGKIAFIDSPVKTSARRWEQHGLVRTTLRNWLLVTLYLLGVSTATLQRFY